MKKQPDVVLIGMPGCGKSTVGRRLSFLLMRGFLDLDKEIERVSGKTVSEIFAAQGEDGFRKAETEALRSVLHGGRIIASGGGIVTREENRELLKDSFVVYIDRPLSQIEGNVQTETRPLLQTEENALERLWEERKNAYSAWADIRIENTGTAEEAAEILKQEVLNYENHCH